MWLAIDLIPTKAFQLVDYYWFACVFYLCMITIFSQKYIQKLNWITGEKWIKKTIQKSGSLRYKWSIFFLTLKSEWNSYIFVKHTNQTHAIVQFKWLHSEIAEKQSQKPFNKKNETDKA